MGTARLNSMAQTRILFFALALLGIAAPARADVESFYGNWENAEADQSGIAHVEISPAGGNHVSVRIYGNCHPTECNWGEVQAQGYTSSPGSGEVTSLSALFNSGFARKQILFREAKPGELLIEVLTVFIDGSGRHDFDITGRLKRTAWAGPIGLNWENQAGQNSGWGGGAHSGASLKPSETCTAFDPAVARMIQTGARWKIVAGKEALVDAIGDEGDAQRVLSTIRHYGFDRKCHVGTAVYWKHGAHMPEGKMGGTNCIAFNPTTAHASQIGHRWKVVDGVQWIADFGDDKGHADSFLSLIRFYRLDAECFVNRANPVMTYWLAF